MCEWILKLDIQMRFKKTIATVLTNDYIDLDHNIIIMCNLHIVNDIYIESIIFLLYYYLFFYSYVNYTKKINTGFSTL